jgi:hypothetical protein
MGNVTKLRSTGVADMTAYAAKLATGIAESRATTIIPGGKPFLKILKSREWAFGSSNDPVQTGSHWVINIMSLQHGWSCWLENELKGEVLAPMTEPKPVRPDPIMGKEFAETRAFDLKCIDGDDAGTEVTYKNSSKGCIRAVDDLLDMIYKQLNENPNYSCPVVTLNIDSYQHSKWNEIFTPVFDITGWADISGNLSPDEELEALPEPEPEPAPAPAVKKKPPLTTAQPAPTATAHAGQRRRPGR